MACFLTLPWRGRVDANEMSGGVGWQSLDSGGVLVERRHPTPYRVALATRYDPPPPGEGKEMSVDQLGNVQLFSSLVAAITSRSSFGPGTGGLEVKMSHWFLILSAGNAVTAYISCIN